MPLTSNLSRGPEKGPTIRRLEAGRTRRSAIMRILILGGDGYLGWPTAMYFSARGHDVHAVDNYLRRRAHDERGTDSLTPIGENLPARAQAWNDVTGKTIGVTEGDLLDWAVVEPL